MRRPRKRAFLILAALSLLVPALLLSLLGLKLLRDFSEITGEFQAEYGNHVARLATQSVEDALWEYEQLNMVSARLRPPTGPRESGIFLNNLISTNPHYLHAFLMVPEGLVHYSSMGDPLPPSLLPLPRWIVDPLLATLADNTAMPSGLQYITSPDSLPPVQVTYFTMHSSTGEFLGTAGFIWDLDYVKRNTGFFERTLAQDIRSNPDMFRPAIFESPISVSVVDERNRPFYTTHADSGRAELLARRSFSRMLPFYAVEVRVFDDAFSTWVHRVVRTSLGIIAAMFLVIVAAVIISLRFVFREIELAELKSTLVGNVSHELKTPLALIRLFSETLQMGRAASPEKEKEFLQIIHQESERLTHLIDNVLDVGRIEQDRKTYRMRPVDVAQVIRGTLDAYALQLEQQGFEVEARIAEGLPPVTADPDALTQALLNLMDNAIKYSIEQKFLEVSLDRNGDALVIGVRDAGIGIHPRDQERIFDLFYRVEKGLVHSVKGSGLGLSLVKHIVDAHGGRITVESRPGRGSLFSISIPVGDGPEPSPDAKGTPS